MTEVSSNASLGLVYFTFLSLTSAVSFVLPYIVKKLGPANIYYFYGGVSLLVTIIHFFVVKETAHLTDREKK